MMRKALLITVSLLGLLLTGCIGGGISMNMVAGEGPVVTETRDVSNFDAVQINMGAELIIEQGDEESLEIEARENLHEYLTSEVRNGTLVLSVKEGTSIVSGGGITYYLTVKDLEEIKINGAVMLSAKDLDLKRLTVTVNGTGTCTLTGKIDEQDITISGGATYSAYDAASDDVTVTINGVGTVTVNAENSLDVTINGSGTVTYTGSPTVKQSINGIGAVNPR